jgi:hypothetical protein
MTLAKSFPGAFTSYMAPWLVVWMKSQAIVEMWSEFRRQTQRVLGPRRQSSPPHSDEGYRCEEEHVQALKAAESDTIFRSETIDAFLTCYEQQV